MRVTPHAHAQVAAIVALILHALPRCIAQPPACNHRQEAGFPVLVDMDGWANVLMCWVVAVCAGRGNFDLGLGLGFRGFASNVTGLEDHGEALAGRRGDAFGRALIFDRLMSVGTLGTKVIHADDGVDDRLCRASDVRDGQQRCVACV